ncbi:MAG TPA: LuxR C-terminal-related transcriptional regulator [Anaerolineaceae bacterium]|nr:LuxR C-terminal-related transcriptional regulator [Anaerolineaceae bacterium]HPN52853.1 LuxR C-terminal-related transcriptional regulator [Anaerolineaceae bacterium]
MLPLLRTKTIIPPTRPRQVERMRLLALLDAGIHRALTMVVAPAGFGKTTLAAAWASRASMPVAWLSLQPTDSSPERFLSYLIQALQNISPQIGQTTLAMLHGAAPDGALFALVNDLAEIEEDFTLILDDFHSIETQETTEILQFLLTNRPASFHLVLTSRVTPTLNLARLRAVDQVTEIGTAELRFTPAEISEFLENSMGLHPSAAALSRLGQSTEGWAVGLQLAALAMVRQPEPRQMPTGQALIFDYLAHEVLLREPPEVQQFLIQTSLFDRFCAPLCDHLLAFNPPHAADLLAYLERANLFLVSLDASGIWYRYHALFAEFLHRQLPPDRAAALYSAASAWFEQNNLLDDAIHYAMHAGDYERAAALLEAHYLDMLQRGEQASLTEWINAMPASLMQRRPRLWLAKGWTGVISLDPALAAQCAEKAVALTPPDSSDQRLLGEAKTLQIMSGIFSGKPAAAAEISEAFVLLAEQDEFLHSLLHFNLGLHYVMQGETAEAIENFNETLRLTHALNNPLVTMFTQVQLGEARVMRGALGLAERTYQQVIQTTRETLGDHTVLLGLPYISYADLLREQNRLTEARPLLEQGIAYCMVWQPVTSLDGQISLARLNAAQGRWDEAFTRLEQALKMAQNSVSILDDTLVAINMAHLWLLQGNLEEARHIIQLFGLDDEHKPIYFHFHEIIQLVLLRARMMECSADPRQAAGLVASCQALVSSAESRERITPAIEGLILCAYASHALSDHPAAVLSLSRALSLGAQGGYLRIFADEGKRLLHLLEQYRSQLHAPAVYTSRILTVMRAEGAQPIPPDLESPIQPETGSLISLTRRELDILTLIAAGKSNQEIAAARILTLNTVKKHVANILSKMGVVNRTQAVMLARKIGWLP